MFSRHNSHLSLLFFSPGLKTQPLPAEAVLGQFKLGLWQGTVVLSEWGGGAPAAQLKYRLLVSLQANGNQLWGRFNFSGSKHSPREETLTLSQPELLGSSKANVPCALIQVFHQPNSLLNKCFIYYITRLNVTKAKGKYRDFHFI